jgi:ThiF family
MRLLQAGLGNIGLPVVEHLVRAPGVESLVLVDPDSFTAENVGGQMATPDDVGKPKALVAAERARRINPALEVVAFTEPLENIPLESYRGRTILSALDSRLARMHLSEIAFGVGVRVWIDLAVRADGKIARASVMRPACAGAACLCCSWTERDFAAVSEEFSCSGSRAQATRAPTYLGATAAALGAHLLMCSQAEQRVSDARLRHHYFSMEAQKTWVTTVLRNPACRLAHERVSPPGGSAPGPDPILCRFLEESWNNAVAVASNSDILDLEPYGNPPSMVLAHFRAACYIASPDGPAIHNGGFAVGFRFPADYLSAALPWEVMQILGPLNIWHPNARPPAICLGPIRPGTELRELLFRTYELITYQRRSNPADPLNPDASSWVRRNWPVPPADLRPLKWRRGNAT